MKAFLKGHPIFPGFIVFLFATTAVFCIGGLILRSVVQDDVYGIAAGFLALLLFLASPYVGVLLGFQTYIFFKKPN